MKYYVTYNTNPVYAKCMQKDIIIDFDDILKSKESLPEIYSEEEFIYDLKQYIKTQNKVIYKNDIIINNIIPIKDVMPKINQSCYI